MKFIASLGWQFVLRITGHGMLRTESEEQSHRGRWDRVDQIGFQEGQNGWSFEAVRYGKSYFFVVNLVASRTSHPREGCESVWYLASNCSLSDPIVPW